MLSDKDREEIVAYKRQKAYDTLHEAEKVAGMGLWNLTGNRLYYATFHMASALLVYNGLSAHTHNGVIHLIGEHFVKKGLLDKDCGRLLSKLYSLRQSGDYDDRYNATEEEVMGYFPLTQGLLQAMEKLMDDQAKAND